MKFRFLVIAIGFAVATLSLIWRMVDLMVMDRTFLLGQGNARSLRVVNIPAYRGIITDRNGQPLAVSTPVAAVWLNPKELQQPNIQNLENLAELLQIPLPGLKERILRFKGKEFVYLKRGLNPFDAEKIKALKIPGIYVQREFRRYYPEGEVTAQLVGMTDVDDQGQEGIELGYNDWIRGIPGKKRVIKDRMGRTVSDVGLVRAPQAGRNIALSIDRRIQYIAYRELKQGIDENKARSGSLVVLDVKTGEVLAMVNLPSFNPNNRPIRRDAGYRNRAVTDIFEPGSTLKSFSVINGLLSGKFKPTTIIDTRPGQMRVESNIVKDIHSYGVLDVTGVLKKSSNVGVTKITLATPNSSLRTLLHQVGFGKKTESNFPGEGSGVLPNRKVWNPFALATLAFGYGVSVTNLQLAQAYATIANEGKKVPISLVRVDTSMRGLPKGTEVIKPEVARTVVTMLESVLQQGGSATSAQVPGYRVSGKTGTTRIVGKRGYEKDRHTSLFVGMAPATNPRLVIAIVVNEPQRGVYYGGAVAGPIFARVMSQSLSLLAIPPDNLNSMPATNPSKPNQTALDDAQTQDEEL